MYNFSFIFRVTYFTLRIHKKLYAVFCKYMKATSRMKRIKLILVLGFRVEIIMTVTRKKFFPFSLGFEL